MGWVVAAVAIATSIGFAAEARACSCIGYWSLLAPLGNEHPSGAPLVFTSNCSGSFDPWLVTVDGVPAIISGLIDGAIATKAITPEPPIGAEVVVMLDCSQADGDPACGESDALLERARFTIGPPDMDPPPPALALTMSLVEDEQECTAVEGERAIDVTIDFDAREPGTWIALSFERADGLVIAHTSEPVPEQGPLAMRIHVDEGALEFPEVCLHGVVHDASDNVTLDTTDPRNIFPATVEDCFVARGDVPTNRRFFRGACTLAPTHDANAALLVMLALLLRRRAPR